jgi:hypothetical protein
LLADLFRAYFKQAREELALRLCDRIFDADGTKNKWWQVITVLASKSYIFEKFDAYLCSRYLYFHLYA